MTTSKSLKTTSSLVLALARALACALACALVRVCARVCAGVRARARALVACALLRVAWRWRVRSRSRVRSWRARVACALAFALPCARARVACALACALPCALALVACARALGVRARVCAWRVRSRWHPSPRSCRLATANRISGTGEPTGALSPFAISSSSEAGWGATATLAGRRRRTDFKDVPNQIETFTIKTLAP